VPFLLVLSTARRPSNTGLGFAAVLPLPAEPLQLLSLLGPSSPFSSCSSPDARHLGGLAARDTRRRGSGSEASKAFRGVNATDSRPPRSFVPLGVGASELNARPDTTGLEAGVNRTLLAGNGVEGLPSELSRERDASDATAASEEELEALGEGSLASSLELASDKTGDGRADRIGAVSAGGTEITAGLADAGAARRAACLAAARGSLGAASALVLLTGAGAASFSFCSIARVRKFKTNPLP